MSSTLQAFVALHPVLVALFAGLLLALVANEVNLLTRPTRLNSKVSGSGRISQPPLEAAQGKK